VLARGGESQPLVFIVIPIHNGLDHTKSCLADIQKLNYSNVRTIVVDDGSDDGSSEYIGTHHPEIILLKGDGQLWWSGAVNRGIVHALKNKADYICLLNNDNRFEADFLGRLVQTAVEKTAECVCSKVLNQHSHNVFFAGGTVNAIGELRMFQGEDGPDLNRRREIIWTGGMGVLFKREIFESAGLFDEKNFPQYFGDADFSFRLRKKGFKILYEPGSVVFNDIRSTGHSYKSGTLSDLRRTLFSIKSHLNPYISAKFYFRHAPMTAPIILLKRFARIFGGFLKAAIHRSTTPTS
jgi:GT2 family glycosyltransferase